MAKSIAQDDAPIHRLEYYLDMYFPYKAVTTCGLIDSINNLLLGAVDEVDCVNCRAKGVTHHG